MLVDKFKQAGLSHRESEVAEMVSRGYPNKTVATNLFVTEKTIKFHLTNIFKKLGVKSRAQLIVWTLPHTKFDEGSASAVAQQVADFSPTKNLMAEPEKLPTQTRDHNTMKLPFSGSGNA